MKSIPDSLNYGSVSQYRCEISRIRSHSSTAKGKPSASQYSLQNDCCVVLEANPIATQFVIAPRENEESMARYRPLFTPIETQFFD